MFNPSQLASLPFLTGCSPAKYNSTYFCRKDKHVVEYLLNRFPYNGLFKFYTFVF